MASLLEELKRRKVFRVGAVYAVASWLLIQVADTVMPALQMPEWTVTFVTILIILGFIPTIIAAWAYELTPAGVKPDAMVQPVKGAQATSAQPVNYLILVIVLAVAGIQIVSMIGNIEESAIPGLDSISSPAAIAPSQSVMRSSLILDQELSSASFQRVITQLELTSDGSQLIYTKYREGSADSIYVRDLETGFEREVFSGFVGTVSLDATGAKIAAPMTSQLRVAGVNGSPGPTVSAGGPGARGEWLGDEEYLFTNNSGGLSIFNFSDNTSELVPGLQSGSTLSNTVYTNPELLPGAGSLLVTAHVQGSFTNNIIELFDFGSSMPRTLITNGYFPTYTQSGHILFIRDGDLWAVPFAEAEGTVSGQEIRIIEDINSFREFNMAAFAISDYGRLIYQEGPEMRLESTRFSWVDRQGGEELIEIPSTQISDPELHPTRDELALTVVQNNSSDIYVYDLQRQTFGRRTFTGSAFNPKWSADGSTLVFETGFPFGDNSGIFSVQADGTGQVEQVVPPTASSVRFTPDSFNPVTDELYYLQGPIGGRDINTTHFTDGQWISRELVAQSASTWGSSVSPDGRWIAYGSNESGELEVYVRPYPDLSGGKWQISNSGGREPKWGPDGNELFYLEPDASTIMSVDIDTSDGFVAGPPGLLVSDLFYDPNNPPSYAVSRDGERFLVMKRENYEAEQVTLSGQATLTVVENFFEVLNRMAPSD